VATIMAGKRNLGVLARLVIALAFGLIVSGIIWRGFTLANVERLWRNFVERPYGSMAFRFVLQPSVAALIAIKDGLADARMGRSAYLSTVVSKPAERADRLREGLNSTAKIVVVGIVMDAIYQYIELETFYPLEALIVALALAFIPYVILRGPISRLACRWRDGSRGRHV
jgi:hypothetical protein